MKNIAKVFVSIVLVFCTFLASAIPAEAYSVKKGDTLNKIAGEFGISVDEIQRRNPWITNKNLIFPGQEIDTGDSFYNRVPLSSEEEKAIRALFDADYYRENNEDVVAALGTSESALWNHYLMYGFWETRQPNADFNVNAYASAYDDLRKAFTNSDLGQMVKNLVLHYIYSGKKEGRNITTIGACLSSGRDVLYYGAYDDGTSAWDEEHIVAKNEEPTPSQPTRNRMSVVDKMWQEILAELLYVYNALSEHSLLSEFTDYRDAYVPAGTTDNSAISAWFDIREANYSTINAQIGSYYSGDIFNYYFDNTTHELSDAVFGVMACTTTAEVKEYLLQSDYQELYEYGLSIDPGEDVDTARNGIAYAIPDYVLSYCCG